MNKNRSISGWGCSKRQKKMLNGFFKKIMTIFFILTAKTVLTGYKKIISVFFSKRKKSDPPTPLQFFFSLPHHSGKETI